MRKKPTWRTKAMYLVFAVALVIGLMPLVAAPVAAGTADVVITGPDYWKAGELVTFVAHCSPDADTLDWNASNDGIVADTTMVGPDTEFVFSTTFLVDGPQTVDVTAYWGVLTQTDDHDITIGEGLMPQVSFNVLNANETFCVPDEYEGMVCDWDVVKNLMPDSDVLTMPKLGQTPVTVDCLNVWSPGWGEADVTAYTSYDLATETDVGCGDAEADVLIAKKKWGKIESTKLTAPGSTLVTWNEQKKEFEGEAKIAEVVYGLFKGDPMGPEWYDWGFIHLADGAVVDWWLMNARAPVEDLLDMGYGTVAGLRAAANDMQAANPPARIELCDMEDPPNRLGITAQTESGDFTDDEGNFIPGHTALNLCADGEEAVNIVVLASYPGLGGVEHPVFFEATSWNFWTQELEKVPQVRWAGEKIVLEKYFGSIVGCDDLVAQFFLENQSIGTLEPLSQDMVRDVDLGERGARDSWGTQGTVVTDLANGTARAILHSQDPGKGDVVVALYCDPAGPDDDWVLINQHGFIVYFLKFERIELSNVVGNRTDHDAGFWQGNEAVWEDDNDEQTSVLNVSADDLLRVRVHGFFEQTNASMRVSPTWCDVDGDGVPTMADYVLPDGRWVLPDDWVYLAGPNWEEGRPHWNLMDNPFDDVNSVFDQDLDKMPFELGDYVTWGTVETFPGSGVYVDAPVPSGRNPANPLDTRVAQMPVIGPYSSLDDYLPGRVCLQNPGNEPFGPPTSLAGYDCRKTIVPNTELEWWDAPMPPAKVIFEIYSTVPTVASESVVIPGPGFFKAVNKGHVYYESKTPDLMQPDGVVYTNPYYFIEVPASPFIPAFLNNGGYDWDSWQSSLYGPYPFWEIMNTPAQDADTPTKAHVYTDNHGEAMIWLNGDAYIDGLMKWEWGCDIPTGWVIGQTDVKATIDYPYFRGEHPQIVSSIADAYGGYERVTKYWTWGKDILGADPYDYPAPFNVSDPSDTRMVFQTGPTMNDCVNGELTTDKLITILVSDRDGKRPVDPVSVTWRVQGPDDPNLFYGISGRDADPVSPCLDMAIEEGFLEGTVSYPGEGYDFANPTVGVSHTRPLTAEEQVVFTKFWPDLDPDNYVIAAVEVQCTGGTPQLNVQIELTFGAGVEACLIKRNVNLDYALIDSPDDPIARGDADMNGKVNMGDVTMVERMVLGLNPKTIAADANVSNAVNMGDVTKIERIILGL